MQLYSDLADLIRQIPERCKEKVIRELSTILHESQTDDLLMKVEKQVIKKFNRSIHTLPINNEEYRTYIYDNQYDWRKEDTGILVIPRRVGFFSAIAETLISLSEWYNTDLSKIIKEYTYMGNTCEDITDQHIALILIIRIVMVKSKKFGFILLVIRKKFNMKGRLIVLYDSDTDYLVETNAPAKIIEEAIEHKNEMLMNDDPAFRSDFEEMQEYVQSKGYWLQAVGYVSDLESYEW